MPAFPRLRVAHLLLMTLLYFCSVGFLMQFPRFVLRIGGTPQDVGWLLALGLIPALLLARPVAEWNHRIGGRWPALIGALVAVLSNVLMLSVEHVGLWMYALRMLYAVGHTLIFSTLFAQAAFLTDNPVQRAKVIGWLAVTTQLGNAVGSTLGEITYQASLTTFWLGGAGFALLAGLLGACWTLRPAKVDQVDRKNPEPIGARYRWPPEAWATVGIAMTFAGVTQFLPAFVDHLVASGAAAEPFAASWFITSALLIVAVVRLVGGWFGAVLLRPPVLAVCHAILLLTLLLVPAMHTRQQALLLGIGFGISYGWLYPALSSLAFNRVPAHARAKVAGWLVMAFECGFRLSPIGLGAVITFAGYRAMFFSLAIGYAAVLLIAWSVAKNSNRLAPVRA